MVFILKSCLFFKSKNNEFDKTYLIWFGFGATQSMNQNSNKNNKNLFLSGDFIFPQSFLEQEESSRDFVS